MLHGGRARGMTKARRIIDVIGAKKARDFLSHIIDLVRDAARSQEERKAFGIDCADFGADSLERFVPGDAPETGGTFLAKHGIRQTAEFARKVPPVSGAS